MQRRAATVYVVLFLVIAAGSYALIGAAEQPQVSVDGDTYTQGENVTVNDRVYNVSSVGDGEGTLTWVNESATWSASWANNSTVTMADNSTYRVLIENVSDPEEVTLRQEFDLSENTTTVTENGTTYVVVGQGENRTLQPVDDYKREQFGEPDVRTYAEGDTFDYMGNETTVDNVTADAATLTWTAPRSNAVSLAEGGNVTLGPDGDTQEFVAVFQGDGEVKLSTQTNSYQQQVNDVDHFNERIAGLWGIVILSAIVVVLLVGLAFLPNK